MRILALLIATILFSGCGEQVFFQQNQIIEGGNWVYDDVKSFEFSIPDTISRYDLILEVKHAVDYDFENVYINIETEFPSTEKANDLVSLQLTDELDQWEGKCNGNRCIVNILLQSNIFFRQAGRHVLRISQENRVSPLQGIQKLKLKILPVSS